VNPDPSGDVRGVAENVGGAVHGSGEHDGNGCTGLPFQLTDTPIDPVAVGNAGPGNATFALPLTRDTVNGPRDHDGRAGSAPSARESQPVAYVVVAAPAGATDPTSAKPTTTTPTTRDIRARCIPITHSSDAGPRRDCQSESDKSRLLNDI